jgi:hypothetical protein
MGKMLIGLGAEDKFHAYLFELDVAAARAVQAGGCLRRECGGRLDVANYTRKVRGICGADETAGRYEVRLSLCCAVRGCRRRATPPSVRFLGRFVYAMRVMVAWAASRTTAPTHAPSRQTTKRWQGYWVDRAGRDVRMALLVAALLVPAATPAENVVAALMCGTRGTTAERTVATHRLLAPLTTATVPPERARSAMAG